jgi:tetratricopeptide (TPR) repeat protein
VPENLNSVAQAPAPPRASRRRWLLGVVIAIVLAAPAYLAGRFAMERLLGIDRLLPRDFDYFLLLVDTDQWDLARLELERHLERHPGDNASRLLLARVHAHGDRMDLAVEAMERIEKDSIYRAEADLRLGQIHLEQRNEAAKAEARFVSCLINSASSSVHRLAALRGLYVIGMHQLRQEMIVDAVNRTIDRLAPREQAVAQDLKVRALINRMASRDRIENCERYFEADPNDLYSLASLSLATLESGETEAAARWLERTPPGREDAQELYLARIQIFNAQGRFEELLKELDRGGPEFRNQSGYWRLRAGALENTGDTPGQIEALTKARELAPDSVDVCRLLSRALYRVNRTEEAERMQRIGDENKRLEDLANKALEDWSNVAGNSPDRPAAAAAIADIFSKLGKKELMETWRRIQAEEEARLRARAGGN